MVVQVILLGIYNLNLFAFILDDPLELRGTASHFDEVSQNVIIWCNRVLTKIKLSEWFRFLKKPNILLKMFTMTNNKEFLVAMHHSDLFCGSVHCMYRKLKFIELKDNNRLVVILIWVLTKVFAFIMTIWKKCRILIVLESFTLSWWWMENI